MRGANLGQLIDAVRMEARLSTASSRGVEDRARLVQMINRHYEIMWDRDWEFLRIEREDSYKAMAAGQRFYDFPIGVRPDDINSVSIRWGTTWTPLTYGITFEHYGQYDSELDQRCDPVQNWVVRGNTQFEVWPLPVSNAATLGFEGKRSFAKLVNAEDVCAIDDQLITLFVAGEILAGNKQSDAQVKLDLGKDRLNTLTAKSADRTRTRVGLGAPDVPSRGWPRLSVAYVRNQ